MLTTTLFNTQVELKKALGKHKNNYSIEVIKGLQNLVFDLENLQKKASEPKHQIIEMDNLSTRFAEYEKLKPRRQNFYRKTIKLLEKYL